MKRAENVPIQTQEDVHIQKFLDMIAPSVIRFEAEHFICGNTYCCVWALREYPTSTDEHAVLSHLGEKDGVTLRIIRELKKHGAITNKYDNIII